MDTSEPSTNGISASNLYRLSSFLNDSTYEKRAKETVLGFESETLQYPWLFASFMPSVVAEHFGVRGTVVANAEEGEGVGGKRIKEFEKSPRGVLGTFVRLDKVGNEWLRERNELLRGFGLDGKARVLICEGGVCREEGLSNVEAQEGGGEGGLDVRKLAEALPRQEDGESTSKPVVDAEEKSSQVPAIPLPAKDDRGAL
jgi:uncharacterized protein YyaL (SSP411 family)